MLFYNHKQEFIGIDEDGLKLLNYNSLAELLAVCSDVADLFAKEPGYIHNFKNFGWIDFLLHADSEATSAIVHANGRTFSCTLQVQKLFLCEAPTQNGYMIEMLHVQSMSGEDIKPHTITPKAAVAASKPSVEETPSVVASPAEPEAFLAAEETFLRAEPTPSILPDYAHLTPTPLSEPDILDVPAYEENEFEPFSEPIEEKYEKLTLPEYEASIPEERPAVSTPEQSKAAIDTSGTLRFTPAEQKFIDALKVDKSYRFDPNVAANELGLPVDLIQEFIGDFIQQSHDFQGDLFDATMRGDMNNLKILSHKLKGVAANLRIEDAFECLSIINTSEDIIEIEANLKYFYQIINKLEGKEESSSISDEVSQNPFKETVDHPYHSEPEPSFGGEDDIYAFVPKETPADEPSAPIQTDMPDYSFAFKDENGSPLIVSEEELFVPAASPEPLEDDVLSEPFVDNAEYDFPSEPFVDNAEESFLPEAFADNTEESFPSEPFADNFPAETGTVQTLHYDKSAIAGALGIEPAFLNELIDDYKHDALASGERISSAIAAFDTHLWQIAARELKGISDNLRLSEISDELSILSTTNDAQEANKASKRLNGYLDQL
ncbi:MAG: hypothetical protein JU82_03800 [Sulfuricurvum sp. MLSB]|uniref:Hpt domain-containing protein n=1 Tax=unclassified Sulfuricurvum TaxID=2632390 RepID=UPI0005057678|nr:MULTISPECIES: Hpt domain-containing protein [unclassified Sulfuricurvum]KFN40290.1 MAG: hypothetical protein JU82_03800 [Sulfuricurvum sp. MLSB]